RPGNDGDDRHPAAPGTCRHLHDHWTNTAGGNDDERVARPEMEALEDLFRVSFVLLQIERRAEPVRADDVRVIRESQLYQGDEAGKAALPRSHLLPQQPRVALAEQEDDAAR